MVGQSKSITWHNNLNSSSPIIKEELKHWREHNFKFSLCLSIEISQYFNVTFNRIILENIIWARVNDSFLFDSSAHFTFTQVWFSNSLEKSFLSFLLWFYRIYIFRSRVFLSDSVGPGSKLIGTIFSLLMTEFYVIEYTKYLYSVIDPSLGQ